MQVVYRVSLFFFLCAGIIVTALPYAADMRYREAEQMIAQYRWERAEALFSQAARLDPYDAVYPAAFAHFLVRQSGYRDRPLPILERAEKLYERALILNPRSADYAAALGRTRIRKFVSGAKDSLAGACAAFRAATVNDPYGLPIAYAIGSDGITVWASLDDRDQAFILDRLRYSLTLRPQYSAAIYPALWKKTGDFKLLKAVTPDLLEPTRDLYYFLAEYNLWQFRKEGAALLRASLQKEAPELYNEDVARDAARIAALKAAARTAGRPIGGRVLPADWHGKDVYGANEYHDGALYWTGTADAPIETPAGDVAVTVTAWGSPADGVYPYMIVLLDGKEIGETLVGAEAKAYTFTTESSGGLGILSVTFANDGGNAKGEDRNLYIGEVTVEKKP